MEHFHSLNNLNPAITGWHIRVKLLRMFKIHHVLGLILSNTEGVMIEAVVRRELAEHYSHDIKEGQWITIMQFGVGLNSELTKATTHPFKIHFLEYTVVKPDLAFHANPHITFTRFSSIIDDNRVETSVLVHLVGVVVHVGGLKNDLNNPLDVDGFRLNFRIRDRGNRFLDCLAMKKEAVEINRILNMSSGAGVVVVVLRWWKIDRYFDGPENVLVCTDGPISAIYPNLNIPEVAELHEMVATEAAG